MPGEEENRPLVKGDDFEWAIKDIVNEHIPANLPPDVQVFLLRGANLYQKYADPTANQWKSEYRDFVEPFISFPDKQRDAFEKVSWFIVQCREEQGLEERRQNYQNLIDYFVAIPYHLPLTQDGKIKTNVFKKEVDNWTIVFEGEQSIIKDCKGLHYIRHLIKNQGKVFSASDLRIIVDKTMPTDENKRVLFDGEPNFEACNMSSSETIVDRDAIQSYKKRRVELKAEMTKCERDGTPISDKDRAELEGIEDELRRCLTKDGKLRRKDGKAGQDRQSVGACIREVYEKLTKAKKSLTSSHFKNSINLGYSCSYRPEKPIVWTC